MRPDRGVGVAGAGLPDAPARIGGWRSGRLDGSRCPASVSRCGGAAAKPAASPSRELFVLWDRASSGSGQPYVRLAMTPS